MNPATLERIKFLQTNRSFLGREYMTWLWYWLETRNNIVDLSDKSTFHLYFNDRIVLSSASGAVREHALKGGTPATAREAKQAVANGKLVTEASFLLKQDKLQWTWSMKSDDLIFRSIRLPAVAADEADAYLAARLRHIDTLKRVKEELFQSFFNLRFSSGFKSVHRELASWAAEAP